MGIDVVQRFFDHVVDLCQDAVLVWGRELYFDATKVEANAGIPVPTVSGHQFRREQSQTIAVGAGESDDAGEWPRSVKAHAGHPA